MNATKAPANLKTLPALILPCGLASTGLPCPADATLRRGILDHIGHDGLPFR